MNNFEIVTRYSSRCAYILHLSYNDQILSTLTRRPTTTNLRYSFAGLLCFHHKKEEDDQAQVHNIGEWLIHPFMHSYYTYTYYTYTYYTYTYYTYTYYYISILVFWKCNPTIPYYQWQRDIDMDVDGMLLNESIEYFDQLVAGLYRSFLSYSYHFGKVVTRVIYCLLIIL